MGKDAANQTQKRVACMQAAAARARKQGAETALAAQQAVVKAEEAAELAAIKEAEGQLVCAFADSSNGSASGPAAGVGSPGEQVQGGASRGNGDVCSTQQQQPSSVPLPQKSDSTRSLATQPRSPACQPVPEGDDEGAESPDQSGGRTEEGTASQAPPNHAANEPDQAQQEQRQELPCLNGEALEEADHVRQMLLSSFREGQQPSGPLQCPSSFAPDSAPAAPKKRSGRSAPDNESAASLDHDARRHTESNGHMTGQAAAEELAEGALNDDERENVPQNGEVGLVMREKGLLLREKEAAKADGTLQLSLAGRPGNMHGDMDSECMDME